jgi:hypothetical protein
MSDVNVEEQRHEKMGSLYVALLGNVLCAGIGWILFCIGFLGLSYSSDSDGITFFVTLAGMVIIAAPLLIKWMATRSVKAMFNMSEYEVITTTTDGYGNTTKTSDGGLQSASINLFLSLIIAGIMLVLALIIQPIRIIIMAIKYAVHFGKAQQKPPFIKTGFFIGIIGVVCLILGVVFGAGIQKAGSEKTDREYNTILESSGIDPNATYPYQATVIQTLELTPRGKDTVTIPQGTTVTVTDASRIFQSKDAVLHIEYNGESYVVRDPEDYLKRVE